MPFKDKQERAEYARKWVAQRRADYFSGKCCSQCGSTELLELDHIDRHQKASHRIWSWSQERRDHEIAKCQILCNSCHKAKSAIEKSRAITHGNSGYDRGCRCDICKSEHSLRMKSRDRRKAA